MSQETKTYKDEIPCQDVKLWSQNPSPGPLPPKLHSLCDVMLLINGISYPMPLRNSTVVSQESMTTYMVGFQVSYCHYTNWSMSLCIHMALGSNHCLAIHKVSDLGQDT